jgi:xanthine dehydrogenase YagR molybdenum-binding subunit
VTSDKHKFQPNGEDYVANERKYAFQSFGAHFVEVQIDDLLPLVRVTRVVSVMDIGRVLNPRTARSQVMGGVVMGLGQVLTEDTHYDLRTGRPINDNFADYAVPVNSDVHSLEVEFIDIPDLHFNPIGCRGVGEIGITGVAAAVANAVFNATGKRIRDLPITPDKLL